MEKHYFVDVLNFRLSNGSYHAYAVPRRDVQRLLRLEHEGFFASDSALRWRDKLPCTLVVRIEDITFLRILKEPGWTSSFGAVFFSQRLDKFNKPIAPEGQGDPVRGIVRTWMRGVTEPFESRVFSDRAYTDFRYRSEMAPEDFGDQELGPIGLTAITLEAWHPQETDGFLGWIDEDGEDVVVNPAHLSMLEIPTHLLDLTEDETLDIRVKGAVVFAGIRYLYATDGLAPPGADPVELYARQNPITLADEDGLGLDDDEDDWDDD